MTRKYIFKALFLLSFNLHFVFEFDKVIKSLKINVNVCFMFDKDILRP